jgi:cytidyltransferase-like protein
LPTDDRLGQAVSPTELLSRRGEWKRNGVGVVCVAGHFDLLHPGHIRLLEQARGLGDVLVVGVLSQKAEDPSVTTETAARTSRPITLVAERVEILAAVAAVDYAVEIAGDPAVFLRALDPDVVVEGSRANSATRSASQSSMQFQLESAGCKVVHFPLEPGYSTTAIVERILQSPP